MLTFLLSFLRLRSKQPIDGYESGYREKALGEGFTQPHRAPVPVLGGAGFTLIELLVTIGIMVLILSTVVFRFSSFDSAVLLKTLAYDIALSVRTAQSYSLSVFGSGSEFRYAYGLSFSPNTKEYTFFGFTNENVRPAYETGSGDVVTVDTYVLGRSFVISDVCIVVSGSENCSINRLDISFRRPEYTAIFYARGYGGNQNNIQSAVVRLQSEDAVLSAEVRIGYTGHVTVSLEEE